MRFAYGFGYFGTREIRIFSTVPDLRSHCAERSRELSESSGKEARAVIFPKCSLVPPVYNVFG